MLEDLFSANSGYFPWQYSKYVQYPIVIIIILYSLSSLRARIRVSDLILLMMLMISGFVTLFMQAANGYNAEIKMILLPILFYIVLKSNSDRLLRPLFVVSLLFILLENLLFYTALADYFPKIDILTRYYLVRAHGVFFDVHVTSLFVASSLYLFGLRYIGALSTLLLMSFQTAVAYIVVFLKKRYFFQLIFFAIVLLSIILTTSSHLNVESRWAILGIYSSLIDLQYDSCYIFGCGANISVLSDKNSIYGLYRWEQIEEIGVLRVFYYYGALWFSLYFIFIFRLSRSIALPAMYFMTLIHYPVVIGVLTTALLALSINYYNKNLVNRPRNRG